MIEPLWRTVWSFLKKLKIELPYDPAIPLLSLYPEKTIIQRDTCTMQCYSALTKKEILSFSTTWMNLNDIMLSEI